MLKRRKFFLVPLAFTFEFFGNLLLKNKCLKCIITLFLSTSEANSEACSIIFMLIDESSKTTILTLVILNLNFELLRLLGKLLGECLEFEELSQC